MCLLAVWCSRPQARALCFVVVSVLVYLSIGRSPRDMSLDPRYERYTPLLASTSARIP